MLEVRTEKLTDNILDLSQLLWKKRILLIEENTFNTVQTKSILEKSRIKIKKSKIEVICFNSLNKPKEIPNANVVLIGLDGLIKLKSQELDLKKIFTLISSMPMANFYRKILKLKIIPKQQRVQFQRQTKESPHLKFPPNTNQQ